MTVCDSLAYVVLTRWIHKSNAMRGDTMTQYTRNILACFKQATQDEIDHGLTWYADAKSDAQSMADKYELPLHIVVGVVAALCLRLIVGNVTLIDANDNVLNTFVIWWLCRRAVHLAPIRQMRDKAWSILQIYATPHAHDVAFILNGPKITDFFWCIMGEDVCVIDGHAWCIANKDRRTMQEVPSIGKKLRQELQTSYSRAGKEARHDCL